MLSSLPRLLAAFALLVCFAVPLPASAANLAGISGQDAAAGVREAMAQGAELAVGQLGRDNGFLGNKAVKIPLPGALKKAEKVLRTFGKGKDADALIAAMNHAAERAVADAGPVLADAVRAMTVTDAHGILTGGEHSVTDYFRRTTGETLATKFRPIVAQATQQVALAETYDKFAGKAASLGLVSKEDADLDGYVTQKAIDGLFKTIAAQEMALRKNPLGASSSLLKKVFGAL